MLIGKAYPTCRYWGYELAINDDARSNTKPHAERDAARAKVKEQRAILKAAGYKSGGMGMTRVEAEKKARAIERRFPDIEMAIFNHDYL